MRILLSYGYHIGTAGFYIERALRKEHTVLFCGTSNSLEKAGLKPDFDLEEVLETYGKNWDLFLYIESEVLCFPRGIEKLPFPSACYLVDAAYSPHSYVPIVQMFDYVFIACLEQINLFRNINPMVFWIPLACDPDIHKNIHVEKIYDVATVGGGGKGRYVILDGLAKHFCMNEYRKFYTPEEIKEVYCRAKIVINLPLPGSLSMRIFEGTSCGTLVITGNNCDKGLVRLFEPEKEIVIYENANDMYKIIEYYLENEEEREEIARNGQKTVLSKHTYSQRVKDLLNIITYHDFAMNAQSRKESHQKTCKRYVQVYTGKGKFDLALDTLGKYHIKKGASILILLIIIRTFRGRIYNLMGIRNIPAFYIKKCFYRLFKGGIR